MKIAQLLAISPLDGRYQDKTKALTPIFSEYGLIRARLIVEIRWLQCLAFEVRLPELQTVPVTLNNSLEEIINQFNPEEALKVKEIEATTNHDVKAIEYYIKAKLAGDADLLPAVEFIHFGCTSEDINNLAYGLMLQDAIKNIIKPNLVDLDRFITDFAHQHAEVAMLARTHGQPATPTTLGKEIANVVARLKRQINQLKHVHLLGKLNGASGNFNALVVAYPDVNWQEVVEQFVEKLGLQWNPYTTQIEPHDYIAELFAVLMRINTILIDFCRDIWGYIALNYLNQKPVAHEVGSSTMPHKINPIDFENAEGNFGLANALFEHMNAKLPISRWQRDLTDSTVLRNMGVAIGHTYLGYQSCLKGLKKLSPNIEFMQQDLNNHWEVTAEAVQTLMRRYQLSEPYEKLKAFTRGQIINQEMMAQFIESLGLPLEAKETLIKLTPADYLGFAADLAKKI